MHENLRIVLVSPRNPLNIGAAARAMSNFGFRRLSVVNAYDVAFREAKSAVGASSLLAEAGEFTTVGEAIADATLVVGTTSIGHRQLQHPLRRLEYGGRLLREHLARGTAALLFGSEKFGLSNDDLSHCHWLVRIPTREGHGSMNLGQSVAVCLYEIIRDAEAEVRPPKPSQPATVAEVGRFEELLFEALDVAGYLKEPTSNSMRNKLRRMIRRLRVPSREVQIWQGITRQILWKLKNPD
ncbi:MAG: RNA methyltransferase [Acidobacteria bacterium]|nr:RNA methyltransferase [Acidobacteriota bacterium]